MLIHGPSTGLRLYDLLMESNFYKAFSTKVDISSESTFTHHFIIVGGITEAQNAWDGNGPLEVILSKSPTQAAPARASCSFWKSPKTGKSTTCLDKRQTSWHCLSKWVWVISWWEVLKKYFTLCFSLSSPFFSLQFGWILFCPHVVTKSKWFFILQIRRQMQRKDNGSLFLFFFDIRK